MPARSQIRLRSRRFRNIKCIPLINNDKKVEQVVIKTKFTTIIASGPNGIPAWRFLEEQVPREDNTIIAVNYSVVFWELFKNSYLKPDLWVVTDKRAVKQIVPPDKVPWFPGALARVLKEGTCKVCFNMNVVERTWQELKIGGPYYTFTSKSLMHYPQDTKPSPNTIRPGGTVSSSAIQIWDKTATHPERALLMCGIDLSGDLYARGKNTTKQHGAVWSNSVNCMGGLINSYNKKRKQIFVISKTKLTDFHKGIEFYPGSEEYLI